MDGEEVRAIGWALCRVRDARGKSLRVVAGLAGMSKDTLNRIERGERSPTLNEVLALADALQISVSELTRLPVPAPANGHTDSTTDGVRLALLDAVDVDHPGGLMLPVAVLRELTKSSPPHPTTQSPEARRRGITILWRTHATTPSVRPRRRLRAAFHRGQPCRLSAGATNV
ncbi:MAG: helix-turn-helix domain-containing protein [Actinomycetota bacterium]|nr:helix-turn-helix domain-containing protein [Actinomycetota bacterium]